MFFWNIRTDEPKIGLIQYDEDKQPIYNLKKRTLTTKEKVCARLLEFGHVGISMAAMSSLGILSMPKDETKTSTNPDKNIAFANVMAMIFGIYTVITMISFQYAPIMRSFFYQLIQCSPFKLKQFVLGVLFILCMLSIPCWFIPYSYQPKIATNLVYVSTIMMNLVVFVFIMVWQHKCGRCKTCLNVKDVKLTYLDESINVAETLKITNEFIRNQFRISLSEGEFIGLHGNYERNIHTFSETDEIQLHEGTYIVYKRIPSEEVKIRYLKENKNLAIDTEFNEKQLKHWLNINSSGTLAIQSEYGRMVHTFYRKEERIKLNEGNYLIRILTIEPTETNDDLNNEATPLQPKVTQPGCSILTID